MTRLNATSIQTRLLLAYIGIILIGFSGLTAIAGGQISAAVRSDYEQRLQHEIVLVAQGVGSALGAYGTDLLTDATIQGITKEFESQVGGKLTLYPMGPHPQPGSNNQP